MKISYKKEYWRALERYTIEFYMVRQEGGPNRKLLIIFSIFYNGMFNVSVYYNPVVTTSFLVGRILCLNNRLPSNHTEAHKCLANSLGLLLTLIT